MFKHQFFFGLFLSVISIGLLLVVSCSKTETFAIDYHYNYFPLETGKYVAYDVDSITYTYVSGGTPQRDTVRYQTKELVADTFYDNLNQLNYRLEVYRRANSSDSWNIWKVWSAKAATTNTQKDEDELNFIKLIFPPKEGATWEGNIYLPETDPYKVFRNWNYTYSSVHQPYSVNGLSFDSTLTVNQVDAQLAIEKTFRKEVYAKNVGLIELQWEYLATQTVPANYVNGNLNGFRVHMRAFEHN
ncbi:MAG: hypothetical protein JNK66_13530 [Chitinophagales bacterium]|nr:hypothetical protein [Chitinophagales bacterium]